MNLQLKHTDPSWHETLKTAANTLPADYQQSLFDNNDWLPGIDKLFNAFSLPKNQVRYILLGESPYPRIISANGYAFWDAAVHEIWSDKGLSTAVNRATSLRNLIKMLLIAHGDLNPEQIQQADIAALDKSEKIQTLDVLFEKLLDHGFLLLNASLVLSTRNKNTEAKYWAPFIRCILSSLKAQPVKLILLGKIAEKAASLNADAALDTITFEHPYNISFIHNKAAQAFFKQFELLQR